MTSALYEGHVAHSRTVGARARFRHPVYAWLIDLDDPPRLPWAVRPFAQIRSRDHLGDPERSIRANVETYLDQHGVSLSGGRVLLLTNARVLGHVFNPLSVYWCHAPDGDLRAVIAEVHNTYGERHCYLLQTDENGRADADKAFYVSPFLELEGRYRMRLPRPDDRLALSIALEQGGRTVFSAALTGRRRPAGSRELVRLLARYQWMTLRVTALIRVHGLGLLLRGQRVVPRPRHVAEDGVQ